MQRPGQPDLGRGRVVGDGDRGYRGVYLVMAGPGFEPAFAALTGDRVVGDERDVAGGAPAQHLVAGPHLEAEPVLHGGHRRDRLGLGQVFRGDAGDPELADQPGRPQLGEHAEVLGDRGL